MFCSSPWVGLFLRQAQYTFISSARLISELHWGVVFWFLIWFGFSISFCFVGLLFGFVFVYFFWNINLYCPNAFSKAGDHWHVSKLLFECSANEFILKPKQLISYVLLYLLLYRVSQKLILQNAPVCFAMWKWTGIIVSHHLLLSGALPQGRAGALVQLENYSCAGAVSCITVPDNKHCPTGDQFPSGLPLKTENVVLLETNM